MDVHVLDFCTLFNSYLSEAKGTNLLCTKTVSNDPTIQHWIDDQIQHGNITDTDYVQGRRVNNYGDILLNNMTWLAPSQTKRSLWKSTRLHTIAHSWILLRTNRPFTKQC